MIEEVIITVYVGRKNNDTLDPMLNNLSRLERIRCIVLRT